MALTFYTSVAKRLKVKVRKFWELIQTFVEVTGDKLVAGGAQTTLNLSKQNANFKLLGCGNLPKINK